MWYFDKEERQNAKTAQLNKGESIKFGASKNDKELMRSTIVIKFYIQYRAF